jgi:hypothetical protein
MVGGKIGAWGGYFGLIYNISFFQKLKEEIYSS